MWTQQNLSMCTPKCSLAENPFITQYVLHSLIFNPLNSIINTENSMKNISTINPAITENTKHSIVKTRTPIFNQNSFFW